MCGIVGGAGDLFFAERKMIRTLFDLDVTRGRDATGIAVIDRGDDSKIEVMKSVGVPAFLYARNENKFEGNGILKGSPPKVIIGHNRWATRGKKVDENAHPFHHNHIVGVHNGTLDNTYRLDDHHKFDVDSEMVFYNFAKNGFEETLKRLSGAWAFVWYDQKTQELNVLRNADRPLYWSWSANGETVFWASEPWMLRIAAGKEDVKISEPELFKENFHYTLDMKGHGNIKNKSFQFDEATYPGFITPPRPVATVTGGEGTSDSNPFRQDRGEASGPRSNGTNAGTSNLHPTPAERALAFHRLRSLNISDNRAEKLINTRIEFNIGGERKSGSGLSYLLADSDTVPIEYEIRLYNVHHPRYPEWRDSRCLYNAKVKEVKHAWNGVTCQMDRYVIIDVRTMSEEYVMPKTKVELAEIDKPKKTELVVVGGTDTTIADDLKKIFAQQKKSSPNVLVLGNHAWDPDRQYPGYRGQALTFSEFLANTKNGCQECGTEATPEEVDDIVWVAPKQFICKLCDRRHRDEETLKAIRSVK